MLYIAGPLVATESLLVIHCNSRLDQNQFSRLGLTVPQTGYTDQTLNNPLFALRVKIYQHKFYCYQIWFLLSYYFFSGIKLVLKDNVNFCINFFIYLTQTKPVFGIFHASESFGHITNIEMRKVWMYIHTFDSTLLYTNTNKM